MYVRKETVRRDLQGAKSSATDLDLVRLASVTVGLSGSGSFSIFQHHYATKLILSFSYQTHHREIFVYLGGAQPPVIIRGTGVTLQAKYCQCTCTAIARGLGALWTVYCCWLNEISSNPEYDNPHYRLCPIRWPSWKFTFRNGQTMESQRTVSVTESIADCWK